MAFDCDSLGQRESKPWRSARQEHRLPQSICQSSASLGERVQALARGKARAPSPAVDLTNRVLGWARESKPWRSASQEHRLAHSRADQTSAFAGRESPSLGAQQGKSTSLPQSICQSSASLGERVQALALSKAGAPSPAVDLPIECIAGRVSPSPWRLAGQEHRLPQSICHSSASLGERVQALALSKARAPSRAIERPNQRFAGRESPSLGARQGKSTVSRSRSDQSSAFAGRESPSPGAQQGRSTISRSRSANRVHRWASESKSWRLAGQEHQSPAIDLPFECFAGRESPSLGAQQGKSTVSRSRSANRCQFREY